MRSLGGGIPLARLWPAMGVGLAACLLAVGLTAVIVKIIPDSGKAEEAGETDEAEDAAVTDSGAHVWSYGSPAKKERGEAAAVTALKVEKEEKPQRRRMVEVPATAEELPGEGGEQPVYDKYAQAVSTADRREAEATEGEYESAVQTSEGIQDAAGDVTAAAAAPAEEEPREDEEQIGVAEAAAEEARRAEEAARAAEEARKAEEAALAAEEARKAEEAARIAAEEARKTEEVARAAEEARKTEEAARAAEEARKAEEAARAAAEEARRAEEAARIAAEEARRAEEAARAAEEARRAEEAARALAEARRAEAEQMLAKAREFAGRKVYSIAAGMFEQVYNAGAGKDIRRAAGRELLGCLIESKRLDDACAHIAAALEDSALEAADRQWYEMISRRIGK